MRTEGYPRNRIGTLKKKRRKKFFTVRCGIISCFWSALLLWCFFVLRMVYFLFHTSTINDNTSSNAAESTESDTVNQKRNVLTKNEQLRRTKMFEIARIKFLTQVMRGTSKFPIIERSISTQNEKEKIYHVKSKIANNVEQNFIKDKESNLVFEDSKVGQILDVWPSPQFLSIKNKSMALLPSSKFQNDKSIRLDKSKGLEIIFAFAARSYDGDDFENRITIDATTEILSSTVDFPTYESCKSKVYERQRDTRKHKAHEHQMTILKTLIVEKLSIAEFKIRLEESGEDKFLFSSSSRFRSSRHRSKASKTGGNDTKLNYLNLHPSDIVFDKLEYYRLIMDDQIAKIEAVSHEGILQGIRSFSALFNNNVGLAVTVDNHCPVIKLNPLKILDYPRFLYRGFLIDSAHHYKDIPFLKRLIFNMGMMKLNTLHWHMTDHQQFGIHVPGEYTSRLASNQPRNTYYNVSEVQRMIDFGIKFGINVLIEIDIPGHALSWEKGYKNIVNVHCKNE
jgi:hypothetical protein